VFRDALIIAWFLNLVVEVSTGKNIPEKVKLLF
jgi:hypothetical protein